MDDETDNNTSRRPATERADELLTRAGWTAGVFASMLGTRAARVAAFAREEAEDMWAEARSMRRQNFGSLKDAAGKATEAVRRETERSEEPREEGAGTGGRITVDAANEIRSDPEEQPEAEQGTGSGKDAEDIDATPAARRHAEELGVDLRQVKGTGPEGRITVADVRKMREA